MYLIPFYVFISSTQEALGLGVQAENSARFSLLLTLLHHSFTSQSNTERILQLFFPFSYIDTVLLLDIFRSPIKPKLRCQSLTYSFLLSPAVSARASKLADRTFWLYYFKRTLSQLSLPFGKTRIFAS